MAPSTYDPSSLNEQPVPFPTAQAVVLTQHVVLQPPLSRLGKGPGIVIFLPNPDRVGVSTSTDNPLDPDPVTKWAEEGFAVVAVMAFEGIFVQETLTQCFDALDHLESVDVKDKYAIIVYEPKLVISVSQAIANDTRIAAFVGYGSFPAPASPMPILLHLTANAPRPAHPPTALTKIFTYKPTSAFFVLPNSAKYDEKSAAQAHSRTLSFLRKALGGPIFDLEFVWDEHCSYEFETKSLAKTMATMVEEPYVNHVPTLAGGAGREGLTAFYRDHFIFSTPEDVKMETISRTVGSDRLVDEFIYQITHDRVVDWLLPGVPPTGRQLSIPMVAIVTFRGDRLSNEHIWWDQATVLKQAGILPSHLPFAEAQGSETATEISVRLPVAGKESADLLLKPSNDKMNEMLGSAWV